MTSSVEGVSGDVSQPGQTTGGTGSAAVANMNTTVSSVGQLMQVAPQVVRAMEQSMVWNFCVVSSQEEQQREQEEQDAQSRE